MREELVGRLEGLLVGPGFGEPDPLLGFEQEIVTGRLSLAYMSGVLFPKEAQQASDAGSDESEGEDGTEDTDDPLSMAAALMPASMGISLCVSPGTRLEVALEAAVYEEVERAANGDPRYRRRPLERGMRVVGTDGLRRERVLEGRGDLEAMVRVLADGNLLVTVSLSNVAEASGRPNAADALFQSRIVCTVAAGSILPYPETHFMPPSEEERELRILYGDQRPFAVGHGVASDWRIGRDGACEMVATCAVPKAYVWRPDFDALLVDEPDGSHSFRDREVFELRHLASGEIDRAGLSNRLGALIGFYRRWIASQARLAVEAGLEADAARILSRCDTSVARMEDGLRILTEDGSDVAYRAFLLANKAMLMSMCHGNRASGRGRPDGLQGPFALGMAETGEIDYLSNASARWRPFQLAFFLQLLPSLIDEAHADRETVDVIWFATGGGKTEAYLLAAAFELVRRRLVHGAAGVGVGVLNRYTYRFLTADQFQRTSGMICALELLRRDLSSRGDFSLGTEEFSVGLFVGGEVSPNRYASAFEKDGAFEQYMSLLEEREPRNANPFPIEACPSCGTLLVPDERAADVDGTPDKSYYGFSATANSFRTFCTDEDCAFHAGLPVYFVDEQLYARPPSFLLGTIDKFAMVPWGERAGRLLGADRQNLPPTLVIQDELHLISGPLGTLAGIYEAGFEVVMQAAGGPRPKVVASTATIRNASTQCRRIYGRATAVFPSPGLRAHDSFFSRLDVGNVDRARLYIGLMGQGVRSTIAVSWAMAGLLQVVHELDQDGGLDAAQLDAFWTLVAYHNSKRELGRIANAAKDEIPTRLKVYAKQEARERPTRFDILELKAHSEIPVGQARRMLNRRHDADAPAVDIAPCTSIISVGIDIPRLGLMMVNGQPKLTAEYIQATSRVGRGTVPGLVATCYSPSKPRDRSHYEQFRDYHGKFYSFVEPTSVTPSALPAVERALHAALVTVVRHGAGLRVNDAAGLFDPASIVVSQRIADLVTRLQAAYPGTDEQEERERFERHVGDLSATWAQWCAPDFGGVGLVYSAQRNQSVNSLLVRFGARRRGGVGWHTLQSMRHVDSEIRLEG